MDNITKLKILYAKGSKHSNYQILSRRLSLLLGDGIKVQSRFENERLWFILENIDIKDKAIIDIGGNTGFFSFELIENEAKTIDYFEGNATHADFVKLASIVLDVSDKIQVKNKYLNFINELDGNYYDLTLLLNVLHHLGDDFGDKKFTIDDAKKNIITQLNYFADKTSLLVFQLGFNWKGDPRHCLFENGTKRELIDFILGGTKEYWDLLKIGIAEKHEEEIRYFTVNNLNIERNDSLGEFLNRPLFILKSKKF